MVGARTGIRPMGWPFFKYVKEFNKTGTVRARTVREFRHTKVYYKDTRRDRSRATGDGRRDWKVSLGGAAADAMGHRATTNPETGGQ
ncbi:MAG: hypothetical protein EZS28_003885 [Streblomastix strix]|uniref:Uncharacterized protein n=1 Tax=Streblomastix strix TaxID=222440 RepID=A0A5J4X0C5_9EUKA|nr:MAG: hypothetical protein EZS28_003885 [Streblomastix strix]